MKIFSMNSPLHRDSKVSFLLRKISMTGNVFFQAGPGARETSLSLLYSLSASVGDSWRNNIKNFLG